MTEFFWPAFLVSRDPRDVLLVSGEQTWRAGEVYAEVCALQARLSHHRVVAVLADNSPAWVIADLACQAAGIVQLPLPDFFNAEQLRHALVHSGADAVLTDQPERVGALDLDFGITGQWQGLTWMRRVVEPVALPLDTAKISFTSGSTGAPKGVCLGGAGLLATARAVGDRLADLPLGSHFAVLPLALLLENVAGVYAPLLRGLPVHLAPLDAVGWQGMAGFDAEHLDRVVRVSRAGSVILVPELLKAWTAFLARAGRAAPTTLQYVAVGGARIAPELLRSARAVGLSAYQGYGLTECGSVLALNRPGDDGDGVGRPLGHAQLSIVDGELQVGTRAFLGYVGSRNPGTTHFPTGDLAGFDGRGHLHLAGRRKNVLITSYGRNVSPEWIEAMLLADPRVLQAVVIGDGQPALSAIVVPLPGTPASTVRGIIDRVNATLPDYARLGHHLVSEPFTAANGMATGNGRPQRRRIHDTHSAAIAALYRSEVSHDAVL